MYTHSGAFILPLLASAWSVSATVSDACRGKCTHEFLATRDQAAATIEISGPSHMVSDLTRAAEWEMVECPKAWPEKGSGIVRLVCTAEDPSTSCDHVTEQGAIHTIVRMPPGCGTGPFARIAAWDISKNQLIPDSFAALNNIKPDAEVIEAVLDYNFRLIPEDRGAVTFDVRASNDPEVRKRINTARDVPLVARDMEINRPMYEAQPAAQTAAINDFGIHLPSIDLPDIPLPTGLPDIHLPDIPSISLPDIPLPTLPSISLPDIPLPTLPSISLPDIPLPTSLPDIHLPDLPKFPTGVQKSGGFNVVNFKKNVSIIDQSVGCSFGHISFDADVSISADMDVNVNAGYAFKIAGQLAPPKVNEFALAGVLSGKIHTTFEIDMNISGDLMLPAKKLLSLGIPGLTIPGIVTLGPQVAVDLIPDIVVDLAFAATLPMTWDFERLDFVFPPELGEANSGQGTGSKATSSFSASTSPGDISGSFGLHLVPKLEFGIDVLSGMAEANVYVGVDVDATYTANGTIHEDFSMDGCQDFSIGAMVKAGATAGLLKFFHEGTYYPIYDKRATLWKRCSKGAEGPAAAIYDNGDGTYTNAMGDLVNDKGQLIDDEGNVIPDADAADLPPSPVLDKDRNPIPDDQLIFDNGDGTYEDAQGNPVNKDGQRVAPTGEVMGCDLDLTEPMVDDDGEPIPPEEVIFDNGDGTFSNSKCQLVNAEGQLIDEDGAVIDFEPVLDASGKEVPMEDVLIDNGDGTYSDAYGNPVDQYGGAIDFDDNGNLIPVTLEPVPEDDAQEPPDEVVTDEPALKIYTPDELQKMAEDLINGVKPSPSSSESTSTSTESTSTPAETTSTETTTSTTPSETTSAETASTETTSSQDTTSTETTTSTSADTTTSAVPVDPTSPPATQPTVCPSSLKVKQQVKRVPEPIVMKRRATLQRRTGMMFGCYGPSLGGFPLPPVLSPDMLTPFF